jgi:hypothetical protein
VSSQKNLFKILAVACLLGLGAMLVRRQLIEPDAIGSLCTSEAAPAWCVLRQWLVQGFANNVYGWLSLGAVWLALLVRWRGLAWLALAAGILGCTLYRFDPAGAGVLLAVLVLGRLGVATGQQRDGGEQRT